MEEIAKYCNERAERARRKKDELHKKRMNPSKYIPTFFLNWTMYVMSYVIHNMGWPLKPFGFKGRDMGQCALSNVGVFGMKKGFAPLCHISGACIIVAMGRAYRKPCV